MMVGARGRRGGGCDSDVGPFFPTSVMVRLAARRPESMVEGVPFAHKYADNGVWKGAE